MFGWKRRRRKRVRQRPTPASWPAILDRYVPYVRRLSQEDRGELFGHMHVFLAEKRFEGCGGLKITEAIRVTIAAQACLLLLHRETNYYSKLRSILVYPSTYVAHAPRRQPDGTVVEGPQARAGESWHHGVVVLSWDDVQHGAADIDDGHNVVLHEFAHQLDSESGSVEGAPALGLRSRYVVWARVLGHEYDRLQREVAARHRTLIDAYGAQNPAEFFAVVTECFFERPVELLRRHPALYEQLRSFYRQDPAERAE